MGTASQPHPLYTLFQPPALIGALLAGEGLALILSLAPGIDEGLLVRFGLASLGIQWIALATIGALYVLKAPLSRLPVQAAAPVCLGVLLLATLGLSTVALQVFDQVGLEDTARARTLFVVRSLAIAFVVGLIGLVIAVVVVVHRDGPKEVQVFDAAAIGDGPVKGGEPERSSNITQPSE